MQSLSRSDCCRTGVWTNPIASLLQDVYLILRDALKEMMTPELASKTLQLYTGLMEDFFGLDARAPEEVCTH